MSGDTRRVVVHREVLRGWTLPLTVTSYNPHLRNMYTDLQGQGKVPLSFLTFEFVSLFTR